MGSIHVIIELIPFSLIMSTIHSYDFAQLRVLEALLRTKSTVRAARELGLTQSAVSHALRKLRATFDDPLFVRVGRGLVPTERARALRGPLEDARAAVERVFSPSASLETQSLRRTFRVATTDYAEALVLPPLLEALTAEAPGVSLDCVRRGDATEETLQTGEIDLAIVAHFRAAGGLVHRALARDRLVAVSREAGPERRLTLARFVAARHVLVAPRGLPGGIVETALAALGKQRTVVLRTASFNTALSVVAATELVAALPERLARAALPRLPLRIQTLPVAVPPLRLGLLFGAARRDDAAHRWLRERIAALF